jgi:AcrR family transcriptional regulator
MRPSAGGPCRDAIGRAPLGSVVWSRRLTGERPYRAVHFGMARGDESVVRLRAAARALFLERGFEGTSTGAICRLARVSKETLYGRFPSKDLLFADVLRELVAEAAPRSTASDGGTATLEQELRALAHGIVTVMLRPAYVALFRLVVAEAPRHPEIAERFTEVAPQRALATITAVLARHDVSGVDADAAARAFMGGLLTHLLLDGVFAVDGPRAPRRDRIDAQVDFFLRALQQPACSGGV